MYVVFQVLRYRGLQVIDKGNRNASIDRHKEEEKGKNSRSTIHHIPMAMTTYPANFPLQYGQVSKVSNRRLIKLSDGIVSSFCVSSSI